MISSYLLREALKCNLRLGMTPNWTPSAQFTSPLSVRLFKNLWPLSMLMLDITHVSPATT